MSTIVPVEYWPQVLLVLAAGLGAAITALQVLGLLSRPANAAELAELRGQLTAVDALRHENREEHAALRRDLVSIGAAVARIEGRLNV